MRLTPNPTPTISGPRNGGGISFAPVLGRGPQGLPGPGSAAWVAGEAVTTGAVRQAPDGSYIKSTASRTTRSSFDATEEGFWTATLADPTSVDGKALSASLVRRVEAFSLTLNGDGTVASETVGGLTTTFTYNADGTLHTASRDGVTITYSYDSAGNMTGAS